MVGLGLGFGRVVGHEILETESKLPFSLLYLGLGLYTDPRACQYVHFGFEKCKGL